ncbi:tRNA (N6-threonylcarbamoyladenosine(37)-N6)-methyltransferase TrmO [Hyperthermus butylicus]|uniref:Universally conserved protein n=1 Tax=Hyperthermus butylicus (strain DSM 5456 / JCM 9403 / PLM1-5) TaxID=415426 RepID=A2BKS9_HYPBU|nr:tRNA (N6-threonylcarbamoyladenosine(37)-N6)-methyltransferase TrmO [Hyperthermus butylicus]ABM80590.1 universally conserved protein [Hyperthermus butylicus DSM 5456]
MACQNNELYCFRPIGIVEEGLPKPEEPERKRLKSKYEVIGTIRVFDEYVEGLKGLEEYSHLIIVYVFHEAKEARLKLKHRVTGRELGIFATRYPPRPNPIAVSVVELVELRGPRLRVRGIDAWTGTPVLDIKPYDYYDIVKRPRVSRDFLEEWERKSSLYSQLVPWLGPC